MTTNEQARADALADAETVADTHDFVTDPNIDPDALRCDECDRPKAEHTTHECDTCDGTGYTDRCGCETDMQHERGCAGRRCPACRGEGRISDRMPITDAIADAETLRCEWDRKALSVAFWTDARPDYLVQGSKASDAAHATFLAVPGLRG